MVKRVLAALLLVVAGWLVLMVVGMGWQKVGLENLPPREAHLVLRRVVAGSVGAWWWLGVVKIQC